MYNSSAPIVLLERPWLWRTVLAVMMIALLVSPNAQAQSTERSQLRTIGQVQHPPIDEMSGIVRSR